MDVDLIREYRTLSLLLMQTLAASYPADQPVGQAVNSLAAALETAGDANQLKDLNRQLKDILVKESPRNVETLAAELEKLKKDLLAQSAREQELLSMVEGMKAVIALALREVESFSDQDEKLRQLFEETRRQLESLQSLDDLDNFTRQLKNLFFQKTMLQGVLEQERDELKNIIVIMASTLTSFLDAGGEFNTNLDRYAKKLQVVKDVHEIQTIRDLLLKETISFKEHTGRMINDVKLANQRVETANLKIEKLKKQMEKIKQEIIIDPLTKIYNRRAFDDKIKQEFASFRRYGSKTSLIMIDIDHFKRVNDTYGHRTGDGVLRVIAGILKKEIRDIDILARYGGEEFAIILPHTELAPAMEVAERLRQKVAESRFAYKGEPFTITASFGVGELRDNDTLDGYIRRVDAALYRAKKAGRNRVEGG